MEDFIEQEGFLPGNHQNTNFVDVCEICGVKRSNFNTSLLFLEHYKKHKNHQEQCSVCKKNYGTKYQVLKHKHLLAALEDFNLCNIWHNNIIIEQIFFHFRCFPWRTHAWYLQSAINIIYTAYSFISELHIQTHVWNYNQQSKLFRSLILSITHADPW